MFGAEPGKSPLWECSFGGLAWSDSEDQVCFGSAKQRSFSVAAAGDFVVVAAAAATAGLDQARAAVAAGCFPCPSAGAF